MSDNLNTTEELVREILASLRTERVMSERGMFTRVQASSSRGVVASPSTARAGPSRQMVEKRTKHRDEITNTKLILRILPSYIPPLKGEINHDSVPRDYDYPMITAYLPKGVRVVRTEQTKLVALNFCDFNLGDWKAYIMLASHKYLTMTKGKNSKIVPQQWKMNLTQSTLLNVMEIPHFGRHQEVNASVKFLLAIYHGGYL
jgi:hypothetical protein